MDTLLHTRTGIAILVFLALVALFLIVQHTAHVLGLLPFLFILACPLMHLFMHGGHAHTGTQTGHQREENDR